MMFHEGNEFGVLKPAQAQPDGPRDRVGKEGANVGSQAVEGKHQAQPNRLMRHVQVQHEKPDEQGFVVRDGLADEIGPGREHAPQFRLLEQFDPDVAMLGRQLKEVADLPGAFVAPNSDRGEDEPADDRERLQGGEPVFPQPVLPSHAASITRGRTAAKSRSL